jgi:hypothetical protein
MQKAVFSIFNLMLRSFFSHIHVNHRRDLHSILSSCTLSYTHSPLITITFDYSLRTQKFISDAHALITIRCHADRYDTVDANQVLTIEQDWRNNNMYFVSLQPTGTVGFVNYKRK